MEKNGNRVRYKYDKKVQSTIKSEDPKQMKELILELYDNMRQAEDRLTGIAVDDLTTAERQILAILEGKR